MKLLSYIVGNSLFAACIYFGLFEEIEGAKNLALFVAWFTGILSFATLNDNFVQTMKDKKPSVPRWIDVVYDVCVVCVFVWFGYWLTAIIYVIHMLLLHGMWDKIEKMKTVDSTDS